MTDDAAMRGIASATGQTSTGTNVVSIAASTAVGATLTWASLIVAARVLGAGGYAEFIVFWGVLFTAFGVLMGLYNETVRAVSTAVEEGSRRGCRPVPVAAALGSALAGIAMVSAVAWAPAVFSQDPILRAGLVAVGVWSFSVLAGVNGALGGAGAWSIYAAMITADAALRLVLVSAAGQASSDVSVLALAAMAASLVWLPAWLLSRRVRTTRDARADVPAAVFVRGSLVAMVGTGSTAMLVAGFPVLIELTSPETLSAEAGVVIAGVMLTRAPLLIPLGAFQGLAIEFLVRRRSRVFASLWPLALGVAVATLLVAAGAVSIGPWLMTAAFGPDFQLPGPTLALLTASAGAIGLLTLTGAAAIASGRHTAFAAGWVVATVVTAGALLGPGPLATRTVIALTLGPLAGVLVHLAGLRGRHDSGQSVARPIP